MSFAEPEGALASSVKELVLAAVPFMFRLVATSVPKLESEPDGMLHTEQNLGKQGRAGQFKTSIGLKVPL